MFDEIILDPKAMNLISCGKKYGALPTNRAGYVQGDKYIFHIHTIASAIINNLPNPFKLPQFKGRTGLDPEVQAWIFKCPQARLLLKEWAGHALMGTDFLTDQANNGTQWYFQCIGGKHRSVAFVEKLAESYRSRGIKVNVIHRDINKP